MGHLKIPILSGLFFSISPCFVHPFFPFLKDWLLSSCTCPRKPKHILYILDPKSKSPKEVLWPSLGQFPSPDQIVVASGQEKNENIAAATANTSLEEK